MTLFLLGFGLAFAVDEDTVRACTDDLTGGPLTEAMKRTVRIESATTIGSGVVISPDGFILTAARVVESA